MDGFRDIWFAPDEIKDQRERLGLTLEQAAARVAAASTVPVSPRTVHSSLRAIEQGSDGFVSEGMSSAIRLGLGLRSLEDAVVIQGRLLVAALRRSGMSLDIASQRIKQYAGNDTNTGELAVASLSTATEGVGSTPVLKCGEGKSLWCGLDQHTAQKHGGTVKDDCQKCVSMLTRAEAHVASCDQCLANAAWLERQRAASRIVLPLEVTKALGAVLGTPLHRLTGATAHQRRQLFGVSPQSQPQLVAAS